MASTEQLESVRQHKVVQPNVKCAVDGCPYYRQSAWDAIHYTLVPENWKCSHHEADI